MLLTVAKSSNYFMQAHRRDTAVEVVVAVVDFDGGHGGSILDVKNPTAL
jgi:hypothetical protein